MLCATTGHRSVNAAAVTRPGWKQTVARRAGNVKLVRVPRLVGFDYVQGHARVNDVTTYDNYVWSKQSQGKAAQSRLYTKCVAVVIRYNILLKEALFFFLICLLL